MPVVSVAADAVAEGGNSLAVEIGFEAVADGFVPGETLFSPEEAAERGLVLFRKHASRYLAPLNLSTEQRQRLLTASQPVEFLQTLTNLNA